MPELPTEMARMRASQMRGCEPVPTIRKKG
jgi:hypothetical protein